MDLTGLLTIEDVIHCITRTTLPSDSMITQVTIDGNHITGDNEDNFLNSSPEIFETIEIEIENKEEVAQEAIDTAIDHADAIVPVIELASINYSAKDIKNGDQNFYLSMDALDLFIRLVSQIRSTLNLKHSHEITKKLKIEDTEHHLVSTMKNILKAKEESDTIVLAELLGQDLVENITTWKEEILPAMKSLKSS